MPISRSQMERQLRMGGGIMNVAPRQQYFLGGIGDALKGAVKGVAKGIKGVLKSDVGKLALMAAPFIPFGGQSLFSKVGGLTGLGDKFSNILNLSGKKTLLDTLKVGAAGTVLGGVLGSLSEEEEKQIIEGRNVEALKGKLTQAYRNLGYDEAEIPTLVANDVSEYTQDMSRGVMAVGGRVGLKDGFPSKEENLKLLKEELKEIFRKQTDPFPKPGGKEFKNFKLGLENILSKSRLKNATGGRIDYARGTDDIVDQASGIMGLPQRTNAAGVKELDLRKSGGFIPPVGVKEKADDIPAMLSNNEFVFTADAVRGMGDGNVNLGAQRMYDTMKKLENKVV